MTSRTEEVRAWAADRFNATGGSVDALVTVAIDQFCGDGAFVQAFVVENLRAEIVAGITGLSRSRDMQALYPDSIRPAAKPAVAAPTGPVRPNDTPAPMSLDAEKAPRPARVRALVKEQTETPKWAKALAMDRKTYRPLLDLTREDLLQGAGYLRLRSDVLQQVAARLQPGQRVGDQMTERELNDLVANLSSAAIADVPQKPQNRPVPALNPRKPYREPFAPRSSATGPTLALQPVGAGVGEP